MKIESVSVSYGLTQSLRNYCNVRPSITLTAALDAGEDAEDVQAELLAQAKEFIHEEIDQALEADGQAARYSAEPRYSAYRTVPWRFTYQAVVIVPTGVALPVGYQHVPDVPFKSRYNAAFRAALEYAKHEQIELHDCSNGDVSDIPTEGGPVDDDPFCGVDEL